MRRQIVYAKLEIPVMRVQAGAAGFGTQIRDSSLPGRTVVSQMML